MLNTLDHHDNIIGVRRPAPVGIGWEVTQPDDVFCAPTVIGDGRPGVRIERPVQGQRARAAGAELLIVNHGLLRRHVLLRLDACRKTNPSGVAIITGPNAPHPNPPLPYGVGGPSSSMLKTTPAPYSPHAIR